MSRNKFMAGCIFFTCISLQALSRPVGSQETILKEAILSWNTLEQVAEKNHFEAELLLVTGLGDKRNTKKQVVVADRSGNNQLLRLQSSLIRDKKPPETVFVIGAEGPFTARRMETGSDHIIESINGFGLPPEAGFKTFGGNIYHVSHRFYDTSMQEIVSDPTFKLSRVTDLPNGMVKLEFSLGSKMTQQCSVVGDPRNAWRIVETRSQYAGMKVPDTTRISYGNEDKTNLPIKVEVAGQSQQLVFENIVWSDSKTQETDYIPASFGIENFSQPIESKSLMDHFLNKALYILMFILASSVLVLIYRRTK